MFSHPASAAVRRRHLPPVLPLSFLMKTRFNTIPLQRWSMPTSAPSMTHLHHRRSLSNLACRAYLADAGFNPSTCQAKFVSLEQSKGLIRERRQFGSHTQNRHSIWRGLYIRYALMTRHTAFYFFPLIVRYLLCCLLGYTGHDGAVPINFTNEAGRREKK